MNMTQSTMETQTPLLCFTIISKKVFCIYYKHQQVLLYIIMYIHTINTLNLILHTLQNTLQDSIYTLCQQANSVSTINNISLASQYYLKVILHIYTQYIPITDTIIKYMYILNISHIYSPPVTKNSIFIICILIIINSKNI